LVAETLPYLRDPRLWLLNADALKRAADLVGSQFQGEANEWLKVASLEHESWETHIRAIELALPAYMLIGYAIEALLKGLVAIRARSDESAIRWMSRTHINTSLADRAGVALTEPERHLVERQLYHAVRWAGRYPAPTRADARTFDAQIAEAGGSIFSDPRAVSTDHYRQACELFDRLRADQRDEIEEWELEGGVVDLLLGRERPAPPGD
jgi:hypothetical protein